MKLLPPPGPERRRQLMWLGLLAVVVAALAWYQFGRGPGTGCDAPCSVQSQGGRDDRTGSGRAA